MHILFVYFTLMLASCSPNNDVDMKNDTDNIIAAVKSSDIGEVSRLLDAGVNVETADLQQKTLLMLATYDNNFDMAKLLVSKGANVNAQDNIKNSPFLYAGASGFLNHVKLFLDNGARFDVFNRYGGTALIPAAEKGHTEVVKLLATTPNFPINHVNNLGWTALMEAVVLGNGERVHTDIIDILLKAGADKNIPDKDGVTALQHAQNRNFKEMVKLLQ